MYTSIAHITVALDIQIFISSMNRYVSDHADSYYFIFNF